MRTRSDPRSIFPLATTNAGSRPAFAAAIAFLLVLLLLAGCGGGSTKPAPEPEPWENYRSDIERDLAPDVPADDLAELIRGSGEFALDLYGRLASEPGNLLVSPLSIDFAFAMTYGGARGQTEAEMAQALHYTLPQNRLHPAFNALDLEMNERNDPGDENNPPVEIHVVNSIWGRTGESFRSEYLDLLALNYGSGLRGLDFLHAPDASRRTINDWVAGETRDRILDLLPDGSISPGTVAVLVNAIYLKAPWATPFLPEETTDAPFTLLDGGLVMVPMMSRLERFAYTEQDGCQILELNYRLDQLSMILLLPATGRFEEFESGLTATRLMELVGTLQTAGIDVRMPKFSFESAFTLSNRMKEMGMRIPFTDSADFSGIREGGGLRIDEAYHKTFINVDEKGTEAAAATAVVIEPTSIVTPDHEFIADRPFLFLICDRVTGAILFLGRVMNPAA
jgi:serpin B